VDFKHPFFWEASMLQPVFEHLPIEDRLTGCQVFYKPYYWVGEFIPFHLESPMGVVEFRT